MREPRGDHRLLDDASHMHMHVHMHMHMHMHMNLPCLPVRGSTRVHRGISKLRARITKVDCVQRSTRCRTRRDAGTTLARIGPRFSTPGASLHELPQHAVTHGQPDDPP